MNCSDCIQRLSVFLLGMSLGSLSYCISEGFSAQHFNCVDFANTTSWFLSFSTIVSLLLCLESLYCCMTRFEPGFIGQTDGFTFGSTRFKEHCSQVRGTIAPRLLTIYLLNIILTPECCSKLPREGYKIEVLSFSFIDVLTLAAFPIVSHVSNKGGLDFHTHFFWILNWNFWILIQIVVRLLIAWCNMFCSSSGL